MPGLVRGALWDGEEEPLALVPGPQDRLAVVRPSLPAVVLGPGLEIEWVDPLGREGLLSAAWSPEGALALGWDDATVEIHRPGEAPVVRFQAPATWVSALAWSPKGKLAVAAGKTVSWWTAEGESLGAWTAPSTVSNLCWAPQGPLAACGYGGAWVFGAEGPPTRRLEWKGSSLKVGWHPQLKYITTSDQDRTVHLWPWPQGNDLMMGAFEAKALSLAWSPTGSHLATSGSSSLLLWDCRGKGPGGRSPQAGPRLEGVVTAVAWGGEWATVDDAGALILWNDDPWPTARAALGAPGVALAVLGSSWVAADRTGRLGLWERG